MIETTNLPKIPSNYGYEPWQIDKNGKLIEESRDSTKPAHSQILQWATLQPFFREITIYVDRDGSFGVARITMSGRFEPLASAESELALADILWGCQGRSGQDKAKEFKFKMRQTGRCALRRSRSSYFSR
ncbi:hypothetical protein [Chamaesiphon sp.]|uniref:hypothetical protein n=1 Tax=Chamaesiphon sp. TaxID=2814140 RepID=UPI003593548F